MLRNVIHRCLVEEVARSHSFDQAIAIAWTRLYLGVHCPSDIVGGWTIAIAWSMVVLLMGKLFLTQLTSEKL